MQHDRVVAELEDIYRLRYRQFLRVATGIVGDEHRGHDAVQDGFARAIRSTRSYRGEGTVEAWVWRIVLNAARAARSTRSPAVPLEDVADEIEDVPPVSHADDHIGVWIAALPERQRLAVFLRYWADLDYRSIAVALEIEIGTVSATLNAAHSALRRMHEEVST